MRFANSLQLGLVLALGACSTSMESGAGHPTTVSSANVGKGCALGVPGAHVAAESTRGGIALTFTAPDRPGELRARVRHAAAMYGPDARQGLGHQGMHSQGGQHGLQAMQLPVAHASSVTDVEGGARFELVPVDPADKEPLVARSTAGAERINTASCR